MISAMPPCGLDLATIAFFLDFDGTLVKLDHHDPAARVLPRKTVDLLLFLREAAGGAVAIVSGRTLDGLAHQLAPLRFAISGEHGATWQLAPGRERGSVAMPKGYTHACEVCARLKDEYAGIYFEEKGYSLLLQFHQHPELHDELAGKLQHLCNRDSGLRLLPGRGSIELTSNMATKGAAVTRFLAVPPFAGRRPVFIGDDVSDEDAFRVVNAMDGISIKVGDGPTIARHRLRDYRAVHEWLASMQAGIFSE